jgi:hypothetical protein
MATVPSSRRALAIKMKLTGPVKRSAIWPAEAALTNSSHPAAKGSSATMTAKGSRTARRGIWHRGGA